MVAAQLGIMEGGPAAIKAGAAEVRNGSKAERLVLSIYRLL
jgi:hypothetical protein